MTHEPYHYQVIARAIEAIDAALPDQPSLPELAATLGMSPAHFQKIFTQWVGISPKRYQQYLTLGHAKTLLENRFSVLDTSLSTGLSSPSRLHDLFLTWEAMSPGEYARRGDGLVVRQHWVQSPFGDMFVMATDKGICGLAFDRGNGRDECVADMQSRWPNARFVEDPSLVELASGLIGGTAHLHLIGAPLQLKVWEALLAIPSGHVSTYSEIAAHTGNPRAVRAVGTAVGRNPIGWLIPCHRAIRKTGDLGGYHWGLPVKRALLAWESARLDAKA
jgi:AraC family transcriptional regulator of adaptative response/methylated-DNA-[protein]-cysteine methyltransferase